MISGSISKGTSGNSSKELLTNAGTNSIRHFIYCTCMHRVAKICARQYYDSQAGDDEQVLGCTILAIIKSIPITFAI